MEIKFEYNSTKDIWCLLNYGKSSTNSPTPTKMYGELISNAGENPSAADVNRFIRKYLQSENINTKNYIREYSDDWSKIESEYIKIAEHIFSVSLQDDVIVYLTINNRCPYSIIENMFFVQFPAYSARKTVMHELWHFYTWYKFGIIWEEKLGKQKYNEIKEALTVLLNVECKDLFPEGTLDNGYPRHKELREKILKLWEGNKDINNLWNELVK